MTSSLAITHEQYEKYRCQWKRIRDTYEGQEHIRSLRTEYLPPTTGMALPTFGTSVDGGVLYQWDAKGLARYNNYLMRALFSGDMAEMVRTAIGILWNKDATVEVPAKLEYIKEQATSEGDSILQLMQDINVEQLLTGRCGVLTDLPVSVRRTAPRPYFTMYTAERILNWDVGARGMAPYRQLNLLVLDESENERQADLTTMNVQKYLVLSIGNLDPNDVDGDYYWARFRGVPGVDGSASVPEFNRTQLRKAAVTLPFIPFTFINATNIKPKASAPPHIDLAELILSLYLNSADLEQNIHEHCQETLVVKGGKADVDYQVGVGATICPPIDGDAKFIGLEGKGLPEAQKHYQNKRQEIERRSGQMIDTRSLQRESGESLKTRLAAQTATLSMIAKACGWGMTRALRQAAIMVGADPNEVRVKPNVNFLNPELFAKTLVELMQAKSMGLPLTNKDLILMMQDRGITQDDVATVIAELKSEPPSNVLPGLPVGNPAGVVPKVVEAPSAMVAAKAKASNPTGTSARGKVRNNNKKKTSK